MNYYPFNIGDYAKHTKYLSMYQDLAYRRLIDLYYINEGPLAANDADIAESIGLADYIQDVSKVLSKFFLISEGFYRNQRCDEVIAEYHAKAERAKGANKSRWKGKTSDSDMKSDTKSDVKSEQSHIPTNNQEPITNNQIKDKELKSPATATDPCPHQKIIELYHETLPELMAVREWTDDRQAKLRSRWKEKPERQSLEWWAEFFKYVAASDFLTGRTEPPFACSLEWLVSPKNFVKVIEGKYENRSAR